MCICVYIYIERERDIHTCIYIYIYVYRERETYIERDMHIMYIHMYIYIYIYTCIERERDSGIIIESGWNIITLISSIDETAIAIETLGGKVDGYATRTTCWSCVNIYIYIWKYNSVETIIWFASNSFISVEAKVDHIAYRIDLLEQHMEQYMLQCGSKTLYNDHDTKTHDSCIDVLGLNILMWEMWRDIHENKPPSSV